MKKFFSILPAAIASMLLLSVPATAGITNEHIDQTNFVVNEGCSGTLIDVQKGYILTAAHCVTDQYVTVEREKIETDGTVKTEKVRKLREGTVKQITFKGANEISETTYKTMLVAVGRPDKVDLAVLKVVAKLPNKKQATVSCTEANRLDPVTIVGNPMGVLYSSVTTGIVSSTQRDYGLVGYSANPEQPLMQISGGIVGGNSGGAVYDSDGLVVGVSVLGHRVNEVLGFAVPASVINSFLIENKIDVGCQ